MDRVVTRHNRRIAWKHLPRTTYQAQSLPCWQHSLHPVRDEPISIRLNVGQQSFAGTVTMGGETHVGLGALDGRLIVGATLAGFDATPDNLINLVALARAQDAAANAAAGRQD
jgi:hypothetical protein